MREPTPAELDAIQISNVPDSALRQMVWRSRENGNSDPNEVARAQIAHAILNNRERLAAIEKRLTALEKRGR